MPFKPDDLKFILSADIDLSSVRKAVNSVLKELQGPLGPIGIGFAATGVVTGKLKELTSGIPVIGQTVAVLDQVPRIFRDITTSLIDFAAKASPAQFKMWTIALDDVQAVIGHAFLPVLELMRMGVRLFGDTLANLLPSQGEVREALSSLREMFARTADDLRTLLAEIGPSVREVIIGGLKSLSYWLAVVARAVGIAALKLKELWIAAGGGRKPGDETARSSVGASAQPASFQGIDEYQRQLQLAAFREPGSMTTDEKIAAGLLDLAGIERDAQALYLKIEMAILGVKDWLSENWSDIKQGVSGIATLVMLVGKAVANADKVNIVGATEDLMTEYRRSSALDEAAKKSPTAMAARSDYYRNPH